MIVELLREHGIGGPSVVEPEAEPEDIDDEIPF
jgi:hypothetical protein